MAGIELFVLIKDFVMAEGSHKLEFSSARPEAYADGKRDISSLCCRDYHYPVPIPNCPDIPIESAAQRCSCAGAQSLVMPRECSMSEDIAGEWNVDRKVVSRAQGKVSLLWVGLWVARNTRCSVRSAQHAQHAQS